jgi:hypothetical protein
MYGPDPYTQSLINKMEQERLDKQLELARLLKVGRPPRPRVGERVAARAGSALVAIGQWLVERSGAATVARSSPAA